MVAPYNVRAVWDADCHVWCASSPDIPGLVAEAETLDDLITEVLELVPQLLSLNHAGPDTGEFRSVPVHVTAERDERVVLHA